MRAATSRLRIPTQNSSVAAKRSSSDTLIPTTEDRFGENSLRLLTFGRLRLRGSIDYNPQTMRERLSLDRNWRFALGHASDASKDFEFARDRSLVKAGEARGAAGFKF